MPVRASDKSVRKTADDAAVSKLYVSAFLLGFPRACSADVVLHRSAVSRGYYSDDFLKSFVRKSARRPPLINRGVFSPHGRVGHLRRPHVV